MNERVTSEWVKALRVKYELTQEQLAERVGTQRYLVSKWENDKFRPSRLMSEKLLELEKNLSAQR